MKTVSTYGLQQTFIRKYNDAVTIAKNYGIKNGIVSG